jgi:chloride channel protein, CIC family
MGTLKPGALANSLRSFLHRLLLRLVPDQRQRLLTLTIVSGVVCGLAAVAFHIAIEKAGHLMIDRAFAAPGHQWIFWAILTPTLGGLLAGLGMYYFVPGAAGSGIPQVKASYALHAGTVPMRDAMGKFVLGALQIGSGASLGREGPTVQICAGISSFLARTFALSARNQRRMAAVGVAAGIAAAFNAPIAAVTFTLEEVIGDLDQTMLSGVIVAAAIAASVERMILGRHPVFELKHVDPLVPAGSLVFYVLLGVAAALASVAFTDSLLGLRKRFKQFTSVPRWVHPSIGGAMTGTLAVVALLWVKQRGIAGGGYDTLSLALNGSLTIRILLILCVLKLLATVCSYSSGGAGGIFAPALFIGGMLGGAVGFLDVAVLHHANGTLGAFALVGMGAVFAGIIRAPMTSVLIIFEMTGSYDLILPLMISNMIAYTLARHWRRTPVYEALLLQDGISLPHESPRDISRPGEEFRSESLP